MTLGKKVSLCSVIVFIVLSLTVIGLSKVLTKQVNNFVVNLAHKMTREVGYPVTMDAVTTHWDWLLLKVNIKNLKIMDRENSSCLFEASEIISTVDTLYSIRSLGLKFKQLLLRSPRLEIQFDERNRPVVLGLGNNDIAKDLNFGAVFKVLAMQRRIVVEDGDLHLQGKNGADLPFMSIKVDFRQDDEREYSMTARGSIAGPVQPEFVLALKYFGELHDFEKAMLEFELKTSHVELAELFNFMPDHTENLIGGNFADFDLKGVVQNGTIRSVASDFTINNILINQDTQIIGGVGHIEYKPGHNTSSIQLAHINIRNDKLYSQPITIDSISTELIHNQVEDDLVFTTQNARVKFMDLLLHPTFNATFSGNTLKSLEFATKPIDCAMRRFLVLLPDQKFSKPLNDWFRRAVLNGEISEVNLTYALQKLRWSLAFKDAEIKFSKDWPSVENIDAVLTMNNGELSIEATKASIMQQPLKSLKNTYSEVNGKPYTMISLSGSVDTTLETALNYLEQTPLEETICARLKPFNPQGTMELDLKLDINVSQPVINVAVAGDMTLKDTRAQIPDINLNVQDITGKLHFTNAAVMGEDIKLVLLEQAAKASVGMHPKLPNTLNIHIDMPLHMSALKKNLPDLKLDRVSGATNISATVMLPWGKTANTPKLLVNTDLVGISVAFPPPFKKEPSAKLPLNLQLSMTPKHEDHLKFKLGNLLDGVVFLKGKKLDGGHIAVGRKLENYAQTKNLLIKGEIKQLNWADWSFILQDSSDNAETLPVEVDLVINSLTLFGDEYKPMRVKYNTANHELYLDSAVLTGVFTLNRQEEESINIKLDKLKVPENRTKNNAMLDYLRKKRANNNLPLIQFTCEKMQYSKRVFKNVHLELLPRTYGYEITDLSITNDNLLLQAQGSWQMEDKPITTLAGNIVTQNFGKVLAEWGYENSISRGKGEMNFAVNWEGGPMDFDVLKLDGSSHLDLRSGSLTNVNPGIGRIIGLLSLESIHRRLQLDFSDILSKGFAFDKFMADFKIKPGSVMSDNILITSPSAKIELFGKTGIKSHDLDFTMYVTPKVGAGLPIAAAIAAGNPAVGAAIWLFDKASGSKISEITKYKYKVSGTWDAPQVNEMANQNRIIG